MVAFVLGFIVITGNLTAESKVVDRQGKWYSSPEWIKGNAFFEREKDEWKPAPTPIPPRPTPVKVEPKPEPTKPKPTPAPKPEPKEEMIDSLDRIYFDYDKSELRPESKQMLKKIAEFVMASPTRKVTVEGHTDHVGSHAYNQALSERRAQAAYDYLVDVLKVPASRVSKAAKGKTQPAATNANPTGRQINRRCEFIFSN
jgi:OmpA-OmpF porin, OOP family